MSAERPPKPGSDKKKRNIIPMELDDALLKSVQDVSNEVGESKATVMRLSIRAGLAEARAAILKLGKGAYPEHRAENFLLNEGKKPKP